MSESINNHADVAAKAASTAKETAIKVEANVRPIEPRNNLLAFASVKIADCFVVDNIKVVAGEKGLMVDMPSIKGNDGKYHNIAFPITADFRKQIVEAILDGYTAAVDRVHNLGAAQREYTEKPRIKEQLEAGAKMAADREAPKPQQEAAAKRAGVGPEMG
jgi:stage V sporulation protein G